VAKKHADLLLATQESPFLACFLNSRSPGIYEERTIMKFYRLFSKHSLTALLLTLFTSNGYGGALYLYEVGSPTEIAYAGAGMAARAQDAGTVFTNPAGMTRFNGNATLAAGGLIYVYAPFDTDSGNTVSGTDGSATEFFPYGSFGYIHSVSEKLKLGVSVQNNFGLGLDWGTNWVGRYSSTSADILAPQVQPTIAYKVNDWLSVGAGAGLTLGYLDAKLRVNNSTLDPGFGDGKMEYSDTDFAVQGNFGIMLNPSPATRIGLRYLTETEIDFEDDPHFSRIGPETLNVTNLIGKLDLGIKMPQSVMLGVFHDLNDKWAILGSVGWDEWSRFGHVDVSVDDSPDVTTDLKFDDTYHVGIGAQYQHNSKWLYSAGYSYDSALSDGAHRSPTIPMGEMSRVGGGFEYQKRDDLTIGAAMDVMWEGDLSLNAASGGETISGEYQNVFIAFFTVYAKWQ
jgi:long-chain fatty acid transport protein